MFVERFGTTSPAKRMNTRMNIFAKEYVPFEVSAGPLNLPTGVMLPSDGYVPSAGYPGAAVPLPTQPTLPPKEKIFEPINFRQQQQTTPPLELLYQQAQTASCPFGTTRGVPPEKYLEVVDEFYLCPPSESSALAHQLASKNPFLTRNSHDWPDERLCRVACARPPFVVR